MWSFYITFDVYCIKYDEYWSFAKYEFILYNKITIEQEILRNKSYNTVFFLDACRICCACFTQLVTTESFYCKYETFLFLLLHVLCCGFTILYCKYGFYKRSAMTQIKQIPIPINWVMNIYVRQCLAYIVTTRLNLERVSCFQKKCTCEITHFYATI